MKSNEKVAQTWQEKSDSYSESIHSSRENVTKPRDTRNEDRHKK